MIYIILSLCVFMTACGLKRDNEPNENQTPSVTAAVAKWNFYKENQAETWDEHGWIMGCDGLLFTSLCKVSGGCQEADIFAAEEPDGKWHRSADRQCFVDGQDQGADSTISKDMFVGLFTYLWHLGQTDRDKALAAVRRIIDYGQTNNWVMGEADSLEARISKTILSPGLIALVFEMESELAGNAVADNSAKLNFEQLSERFGLAVEEIKEIMSRTDIGPAGLADQFLIEKTGFRAHLEVVKILLTGRVHGAINDIEQKTLKKQAEREPRNALFQAAYALYSDGNNERGVSILLEETLFPKDRLPASKDRCAEYLFQRDEYQNGRRTNDWLPCPDEGKVHNGTDLGYAVYVMQEYNP